MAKVQDTTIGPVTQITDLTGGVNLSASPTNIKPHMARRLLNADISSQGELGAFPGWRKISTTSLDNARLRGGRRIYLADVDPFILTAYEVFIDKPTDAGVWGAAVYGGLSNDTTQVDFVYDRDIVVAFDGIIVPVKSHNGDDWSQLGISAPVSAPTLTAVNASGTLADAHTFEVAYAYRDASLNQIGNISTPAQVATATPNLTVRVGVVASASPDVDSIRIYARDVTAGETVLRLQGTHANATANVDILTNTWSGQEEAPLDHGVAPIMSFGTVWKNRWWGRSATVKNRLHYSQIFQPQSWPSTFYVDIPFERGDDITMIVPLGDTLVVFGYTRFYLILGQTSLDFEVRPGLGAQTGAFGFRAGAVVENGVAHAGASGVYLFNGASDELLSYPIEPAWKHVMENSSAAELEMLPLEYHKREKQIRVAVPLLYPTPERGEWILDLNRSRVSDGEQSWTSTDRTIGGYIQFDGNETALGNNGRLFTWGTDTAELFEESYGLSANGASRMVEYDGFTVPLGLQHGRVVDTYIEVSATSGVLLVDLRVDGRLMGSQSFPLGAMLSLYGTAVYGTGTYAGATRFMIPVMWPLRAEGKTVQMLIRYYGAGNPKIYTYGHNIFKESVPRGI